MFTATNPADAKASSNKKKNSTNKLTFFQTTTHHSPDDLKNASAPQKKEMIELMNKALERLHLADHDFDQMLFNQLKTFVLEAKDPSFPNEKQLNELASQSNALQELANLLNKPLKNYLLEYGKNTKGVIPNMRLLLQPHDLREEFNREVRGLLNQAQETLNNEMVNAFDLPLRLAINIRDNNIHSAFFKNIWDHTTPDTSHVKALLEQGADADFQLPAPDQNISLFQFIVKEHSTDIVKLFIEKGADVNELYGDSVHGQITPLKIAVNNPNKGVVDLLIQSGADIHENSNSKFPLWFALEKENEPYNDSAPAAKSILLASLEDKKADHVATLHLLAKFKRADLMEILLNSKKDIDLNTYDPEGKTALINAIQARSPACVKLLLSADANFSIPEQNRWGLTPWQMTEWMSRLDPDSSEPHQMLTLINKAIEEAKTKSTPAAAASISLKK